MCGITGFFGLEDKPLLMKMTDKIELKTIIID